MDDLDRIERELIFDDIEQMVENISHMIKSIPVDSGLRSYLAERIIFESALWGSFNQYEAIGIIDEAKHKLRDAFNSECTCGECDND
jgi:hypothetical protein